MELVVTFNCDIDGRPVCGKRFEFDLPQFAFVVRKGVDAQFETIKKIVPLIQSFMKNYIYTIYWSDVFYCFKGKGLIPKETSARTFSGIIANCGGPGAEFVRKSGNYNASTLELLQRKAQIDIITGFVPRTTD